MPTSYTLPYLGLEHVRQIQMPSHSHVHLTVLEPPVWKQFTLIDTAPQILRVDDPLGCVVWSPSQFRARAVSPAPTQLQDHSGQLPLWCTGVKAFHRWELPINHECLFLSKHFQQIPLSLGFHFSSCSFLFFPFSSVTCSKQDEKKNSSLTGSPPSSSPHCGWS